MTTNKVVGNVNTAVSASFIIENNELIKYTGHEKIVVIPSGVTNIRNRAFAACKTLCAVTIPSGVKSIGNSAFTGCNMLTSIVIPYGVQKIGSNAFNGCGKLKSVDIPNSVVSIDECAFFGCSGMVQVILPNGLNCIKRSTFSGCNHLPSLEIPSKVSSIEDNAFLGCKALTSVKMHGAVTSISRNAFNGCNSLTIIAPEGSYAKQYAKNEIKEHSTTQKGNASAPKKQDSKSPPLSLNTRGQDTSISKQVVKAGEEFSIDNGVLRKYTGDAQSVIVPQMVTEIGFNAFAGCDTVETIDIPTGVVVINRSAFFSCKRLTTITVPDSIEKIEACAFYGCCNLLSVRIPPRVKIVESYTFFGCSRLTSVDITQGVKTIKSQAFESCGELKRISVPASVTNISKKAFVKCPLISFCAPEESYAAEYARNNNIALNADNEIIHIPIIGVAGTEDENKVEDISAIIKTADSLEEKANAHVEKQQETVIRTIDEDTEKEQGKADGFFETTHKHENVIHGKIRCICKDDLVIDLADGRSCYLSINELRKYLIPSEPLTELLTFDMDGEDIII